MINENKGDLCLYNIEEDYKHADDTVMVIMMISIRYQSSSGTFPRLVETLRRVSLCNTMRASINTFSIFSVGLSPLKSR